MHEVIVSSGRVEFFCPTSFNSGVRYTGFAYRLEVSDSIDLNHATHP